MSKHKANSIERYKLISDGFDSFNVFIPAGVEEVATHLLKQIISKDLTIRIQQPKSLKGTITQIANQLELREDKVVEFLNDLQKKLFKELSNASLLSLFGTIDCNSVSTYMFYQSIAKYMIELYLENKKKLDEIDEMYRVPKSERVLECLKHIGITDVSALERDLITFHISNSSPYMFIEHSDEEIKTVLGISQLEYLRSALQKSVFKQLNMKQMGQIFNKWTKLRMDDKKFLQMLCTEVCKHMW